MKVYSIVFILWEQAFQWMVIAFEVIKKASVAFLQKITTIKHPQDVPSSELFYKLNWMTINQRIQYFTSILMFKTINRSSPNYLHNMFQYVKDHHQINTRSAANGNLSIPKLSSKTGQRSFQYRGVRAWNSLSVDGIDYSLVKFKKYLAGAVCK